MTDDNTYEMYVYGHSDDLIEINGDVQEELYANYGEPTHVIVGETKLSVEYDGEWHIDVVDQGVNDETSWYSVGRNKVVEELNDYTEVVVVTSPSEDRYKIDR